MNQKFLRFLCLMKKAMTTFLPCSILHLQHNKAWSQASGQDLGSSNLLFGCYLTNSRLPRNIANIDLTGSLAKMSVMIYD
jgi:hypothetical protein